MDSEYKRRLCGALERAREVETKLEACRIAWNTPNAPKTGSADASNNVEVQKNEGKNDHPSNHLNKRQKLEHTTDSKTASNLNSISNSNLNLNSNPSVKVKGHAGIPDDYTFQVTMKQWRSLQSKIGDIFDIMNSDWLAELNSNTASVVSANQLEPSGDVSTEFSHINSTPTPPPKKKSEKKSEKMEEDDCEMIVEAERKLGGELEIFKNMGELENSGKSENWVDYGGLAKERPCMANLSMLIAVMLSSDLRIEKDGAGNSSGKICKFPYGNYQGYYSLRLGRAFEEDPRLQMFDRKWFHGKDCLDVGCHEGVVTLALVTHFQTKTMHAVDIDKKLISKAIMNMEKTSKTVRGKRSQSNDKAERKQLTKTFECLQQTRFIVGDYVLGEGTPSAYDAITCLSVTKWMHLHQGDEGMKKVFKKFWHALRPNGYLVIEPQPWNSYQRAKRKMDMSVLPYRLSDIQFKPEDFLPYLIEEIGFEMKESILIPSSTLGFARPIYVLYKPYPRQMGSGHIGE